MKQPRDPRHACAHHGAARDCPACSRACVSALERPAQRDCREARKARKRGQRPR